MGNIVLLDDLTINKIAAGEVIERPASVVKEVVENSIDAGADSISIEIKNGGISYIRITDNGKGIREDDLEIAFERHATSKIRTASDLESVKSMGFRGEALASISAIARVELISKTEEDDAGHKIVVEGGNVISKGDIGCPKGTTITIENLFYNTPVRYKFLKKDFTESGYIEDVITRIALVNPNISIKLIDSGKTVIHTSGNGDIKDIVYGIYGKDVAENIVNVEYYLDDMAVKGVIGKPSIARANRANQLFFVNKRYVKDRTLTSAAEQAFKGMVPVGKYGFLILNVEVDTHKLDVNVHPAKLEVRFEEENQVFKAVYHAIKEALLKGNKTVDGSNDIIGKNYTDEFSKVSDKLDYKFDNNFEDEQKQTSSKGLGSFFKNIINKNEDVYENNVIEDIYRDKMMNENYDNLIVKEDGGIAIKGYENKSSAHQVDNQNSTNKHEQTSVNEKIADSATTDTNTKTIRTAEDIDNDLSNLNIEEISAKAKSILERYGKLKEESDEGSNQETVNEAKIVPNIQPTYENIQKQEISNVVENIVEVEAEKNEQPVIEENSISCEVPSEEKDTNNVELSEGQAQQENESTDTKSSDKEFEEMYAKMFGTDISKNRGNDSSVEQNGKYKVTSDDLKSAENVSIFSKNNTYSIPPYKFIGIAFGMYIIVEYDNEMYIINQRSANERILYEKLKRNYYSDTDKNSQLMLLPDIINLTAKEMGIAKDNMELFRRAGFDVEEFGENTVKLSSVPEVCIELDTKELFIKTLEAINTVARTAKQEIEEKFIATVANKVAEKANLVSTEPEVDKLMQQLLSLPEPFVCPGGSIVAMEMSKVDIEKKFSRR